MITRDLAESRYSAISKRVVKTAWLRGSARWQTLENDVRRLPTLGWKKSSLEWMIEWAWKRRGTQMAKGTEECCYSWVQSASMRAPCEILLFILSFPPSLFSFFFLYSFTDISNLWKYVLLFQYFNSDFIILVIITSKHIKPDIRKI